MDLFSTNLGLDLDDDDGMSVVSDPLFSFIRYLPCPLQILVLFWTLNSTETDIYE